MPHAKQILLEYHRPHTEHGGDLSRNRRKSERPLCTKRSLHVVLRSTRAKGHRSLNNNRQVVESIIHRAGRRFRIRVYSFALNHNHIHLSVKGIRRIDIQNFLRVLAGHIAQQILRKFPLPVVRGNAPGGKGKYRRKFWNELVYSRLVMWGRDYRNVRNYIQINLLEAAGLIVRAKKNSRGNAPGGGRGTVEVFDCRPGKDFTSSGKITQKKGPSV